MFENAYTTTFNDNNPEESFKEPLESKANGIITANVNSNEKEKTEDFLGKKIDLNDKITDFNYDILEDIIIYQ